MNPHPANGGRRISDALRRRAEELTSRWHTDLAERIRLRPSDVFPGANHHHGIPGVVSWIVESIDHDAAMDPAAAASLRSVAQHWHDAGYSIEEALLHLQILDEILHAALREEVATSRPSPDLLEGLRLVERLSAALRTVAQVMVATYRDHEEARFQDFSSALFHEVSNSIHAALGSTRALEESADGSLEISPDQRSRLLRNIRSRLEEASRLTAAVYWVSMGNDGDSEGRFDSLARLIADTVNGIQSSYREGDIDVRIEVDPVSDDFDVPADPARLVLHNLIDNGVKHADPDNPDRWVRVRLESGPPGRCTIRVEDNGRGIPEEERELIFGRFQRGEGARGSGFGMGLSIARHASRMIGGDLTVVSELGRGSTFVFDLPVRERDGDEPN